MSLVVRNLDPETDALAVMDGAREFISRMDYTDFLPDDENHLAAAMGRLVGMDEVKTLIAEYDGQIVGGIGMLYAPHIWNPGLTAAEELFWWAADNAPPTTALRLLRAVRDSARRKGAAFMTFKALTSSPAGVDRVYRRMGMQPVETSYMGAV